MEEEKYLQEYIEKLKQESKVKIDGDWKTAFGEFKIKFEKVFDKFERSNGGVFQYLI